MDRGLQALLGAFHPRILLIAAKLHELIYELNPSVRMDVNVRSKLLLYRMEGERPFCTVELHKGVVKLHFPQGALLDDPCGLLKGTGKTRRVILNTPAQAGSVAVQSMLSQAIQHLDQPQAIINYSTGDILDAKFD